jgi:hypothetical protein
MIENLTMNLSAFPTIVYAFLAKATFILQNVKILFGCFSLKKYFYD